MIGKLICPTKAPSTTPSSRPAATTQNLARAETFVRGLQVTGGTQLLDAVNAALDVPVNRDKQRYFIFRMLGRVDIS